MDTRFLGYFLNGGVLDIKLDVGIRVRYLDTGLGVEAKTLHSFGINRRDEARQ